MLANSNLPLISPKSTASVVNSIGEPPASNESFDNVFQQVTGNVLGEVSPKLEGEGASIEVDNDILITSGGDSALLASEGDPALLVSEGDNTLLASEEDAILDVDGNLIAADDFEAVNQEGIISSDSLGNTVATGLVANGYTEEQKNRSPSDNDRSLNELEGRDNAVSPILPKTPDLEGISSVAGVGALGQVSQDDVAPNVLSPINSDPSTQNADSNQVVSEQVKTTEGLSSQTNDVIAGGNSLQAEGENIASLVKSDEDSSQIAASIGVAGALIAAPGSNHSDLTSQSSEGLKSNLPEGTKTKVNFSAGTNIPEAPVAVSGTFAGTEFNKNQIDLKSDRVLDGAENSTGKVSGGALTNIPSNSVDKFSAAEVGKDKSSVDIAAGLAMLGAGATSHNSKAQEPIVTNQLVSSAEVNVADTLDGKRTDLDWIMQQMDNELPKVNETGLVSEGTKLTPSMNAVTQANGQMSDQLVKPAVPLSLGLATVESGLLDSKVQTEALAETNSLDSMNLKLDPESSKQTESNSVVRPGLGDSLAAGATATATASQANSFDAKLGLTTNINNNQNNMTMQVPPNHPNWSSEMGEKMMWMNRQGIQQAEIHLDPPELGSLTVKVSVDSDVASVSFVAASTQVKDLLEGQVQRLREMLAQQGVELAEVDVNVSQQGSGSNQSSGDAQNQFADNGQEIDELDSEVLPQEARVSQSKVDFYA